MRIVCLNLNLKLMTRNCHNVIRLFLYSVVYFEYSGNSEVKEEPLQQPQQPPEQEPPKSRYVGKGARKSAKKRKNHKQVASEVGAPLPCLV